MRSSLSLEKMVNSRLLGRLCPDDKRSSGILDFTLPKDPVSDPEESPWSLPKELAFLRRWSVGLPFSPCSLPGNGLLLEDELRLLAPGLPSTSRHSELF